VGRRPGPVARLWAIFKRELGGYFVTPLAYVFIVIFLLLAGVFTFSMGGFFEAGQADLRAFFNFHPWLYLFLIPAVSMRLWAEERKSGTVELLMTLPVPLWASVLGKFLAAWVFCGLALALTFPIWITVSYLGDPDNGTIVAGYLGSFLMAGGFLAIGSCISATTRSQVIAFVVSVVVCFAFLVAGFSPVMDQIKGWAPQWLIDQVARFSFMTNFELISRGVLALRDLVFFFSLIALFLYGTGVVLEAKKA
jgi:ABC-2 type transport system permease protein